MSLKPQNIVQAAHSDLARRERNRDRVPDENGFTREGGQMEHYAFHRKHVRKATSVRDLIARALANPEVVIPVAKAPTPGVPAASEKQVCAKRNTVFIYRDTSLLELALALCPVTEVGNGE